MAFMTLALLLFLLMVYIPGNVVLVIAGYRKTERTLSNALVMGSMIFAAVFLVVWLLQVAGYSDIFTRLSETILAASGIIKARLNMNALLWVFIAEYSAAFLVGLVELFMIIGCPGRKKSISIKKEDYY